MPLQKHGWISLLLWIPSAIFAQSEQIDFSRDIQPILSNNCFYCHGPDENERQADLRLDKEAAAHEYAISPGEPDDSEVITRVTSDDPDELMPPPDSGKSLTPRQIELLTTWIRSGAKYEKHWAFRPVRNAKALQGKHPIDFFVDRRLAKDGLTANSQASLRTLARRSSLDLTGLPPTPEDVAKFERASAKDPTGAYERWIDDLLASPSYGERMAWDWLDAARYADTNGYQGDNERTMWPWRDWVVNSFNSNMPWDQFTMEQIAGDLLPDATDKQVIATGFCRNHMINGEGGRIAEENRVEYVMDMLETVGTVWMAMTFECCRCHDHKFDALTQRDYFSLGAYFNQTPVDGSSKSGQTAPVISLASEDDKAKQSAAESARDEAFAALRKEEARVFGEVATESELVNGFPKSVRGTFEKTIEKRTQFNFIEVRNHIRRVLKAKKNSEDGPALKSYNEFGQKCIDAMKRLETVNKQVPRVMVMRDTDEPRETFVLEGGLYNQRREKVTAATPAFLQPPDGELKPDRLALAKWIVANDNPLTARVTVNRFWQMLFGIGIVKTAEDFGVQAEYPSHPDLLDWLANELVTSGWDVKHLLKSIMTSQTYQRCSDASLEQLTIDPNNRLLSRGPRFRMTAWMIRDQALKSSGLLNTAHGGPSVNSYQPPGVWKEATFGKKTHTPAENDDVHRRSLYIFWRRIIGPTIFFDNAKRQTCKVNVSRTNTPLHALTTLNSTTYVEAARALAETVMLAHDDVELQLQSAVERVLLRKPTEEEMSIWRDSLEVATQYYKTNPQHAKEFLDHGIAPRSDKLTAPQHAAMATVCLNILNLDETVTRE